MKKIRSVLLLGSGALKIGEAGEFDYSGTQAIKALKEEGIKVILVNPNIATIQTSVGLAQRNYFIPVQATFVEEVIKKEKPDGILLGFGGQTALNCGIELFKCGCLKRHGVNILGTPIQTIILTEDRQKFARTLKRLQFKTAQGNIATNLRTAKRIAKKLGYPVMIRSGFALGGSGSGVAKTETELTTLVTNALAVGTQVIIEEDLTGWKEVEYEVVRDRANNVITVCNMENLDPVGIHTGESIVVAPSQTLSDQEYYGLRSLSISIIRALGVIGECNIQFALHPKSLNYRIIEVNARLSRSSALASKATGYPLAYIAAKLALGFTLPQLKNCITQKTSAFFEPALDYVTVKFPRWDLDKYEHVDEYIGSEMKSVGEVMAIGRTFTEAIQKAARMLGEDYQGVLDDQLLANTKSQLLQKLARPSAIRLFLICAALSRGCKVTDIQRLTRIDAWFIEELVKIVTMRQQLLISKLEPELLKKAKQLGFADVQIADYTHKTEAEVRSLRERHGIKPCVKRIDTLAGEFPAQTNYLYLTYSGSVSDHQRQPGKTVIVLGSGPYAIGTSVEFDWCAVNTVMTLRQNGVRTVVINCNPETVSTDYDYSDVLYFEELTLECMHSIYEIEHGAFILSVGGQIPNNLAIPLAQVRMPILGTAAADIYRAEHRETFSQLLDTLGIKQPSWIQVKSLAQAKTNARRIGYPILIRPSFVLSGKGMSVVESEEQLVAHMRFLKIDLHRYPLVMTKFLDRARECDVDGVASKGKLLVTVLSEHLEDAGVHSGDATLTVPPFSLADEVQAIIYQQVAAIARSLKITGPFNIQFLVKDGLPYVIECNARASRSFPFISKTYGINLMKLATQAMLKQKTEPVKLPKLGYWAVKSPQFSFNKLRGADPVLRVEMSSTGEVASFAPTLEEAFLLSILSTGYRLPQKKTVFVSLGGINGKLDFLYGCQLLWQRGYTLYATNGTHIFLRENGILSIKVNKLYEGKKPTVEELLLTHALDLAVVIPEQYVDTGQKQFSQGLSDGYYMRRMATDLGVPIFTNAAKALLFVKSVCRYQEQELTIQEWQSLVFDHRKENL